MISWKGSVPAATLCALALLAAAFSPIGCGGRAFHGADKSHDGQRPGTQELADIEAGFHDKMVDGPVGIFPKWNTPGLKRMTAHARRTGSVDDWMAAAAAAQGKSGYQFAADCWYKIAKIYRERDNLNMAFYAIREAQQRETKTEVFIDHPADKASLTRKYWTGGRFEPIFGCYNGAFIDDETSLDPVLKIGHNTRRSVSEFNARTGSHHAFFFIYLGYGQPFPKQWAAYLKSQDAGLQIAFEPKDVDEVKDDAYLEQFAADAKASGIPVFLRFASEMNGDWVAYHKSPAKYIKMFRLVASVMHAKAPNTAMVWNPFEIPERKILEYYPGDAAVDWVGVNIYSVLYNDNDPNRVAQWRNPADQLKFVYSNFAGRKPIYIGEFGAANKSSLDMKPRPDYAIVKAAQMLTSLRLIYPRVKAFHWLSMNAIKHAIPGRQLNNYSLLDDPAVTLAYSKLIADPHFLKAYAPRACAPVEADPLKDGASLKGQIRLEAWVKTYNNLPTVIWQIDGKEVSRQVQPGSYPLEFNTGDYSAGKHRIDLYVLDQHGLQVDHDRFTVTFSNSAGQIKPSSDGPAPAIPSGVSH